MSEKDKEKKLLNRISDSISNLRRSVKLLFLTILAVIIMILGIILFIIAVQFWSLDLGSVYFILAALVSGFVHIITANMWRRARKKEREVRS